MKQMVCSICSYIYDEAKGIPEAGIALGTKWEELPDDWKCPLCGVGKSEFREKTEQRKIAVAASEKPHVEKELSAMEMSIICSNLARGCEKQYMEEQAKGFKELADFFREKADPVRAMDSWDILKLLENDLIAGYPYANRTARQYSDRGALRCQTWSERVTHMLQSLLMRYEAEGEKMLEDTGVYVCTICGFVYVGDAAPEICPVCKVAGWKFEKIEGRSAE